ncbi:DUF1212-domain-containing protein [Ascobolus immersus RN42]|uniref:DUF1212-domain-containing protein n=1 Tax=Ascobolus immersus RN42 TaxID=1160509 RepID=A0A3N4IGQ3_ASCIM|nr:DUF1212-domain-containing protein [Ascobolus immersus RN42]
MMSYGAPTHRLEEILRATSHALKIEGQFLYLPSYMFCSFDDTATHTSETRIVRQTVTELNLQKLDRTYKLFKKIINSDMYIEDATKGLEEILQDKPLYPTWLLILLYGVATAAIGPVAFEAGLKDIPVAACLGIMLGVLQLLIVPLCEPFGNVFETIVCIIATIIARALGSIDGGKHFCFSALAQSAIVLILPGYMILCSALELQTRNMVTGSVRMVYAIIYSLFLGFGFTIGSTIYGLIDKNNATSAVTCTVNQLPKWANFIGVPIFVAALMFINHASLKQIPVGVFIGTAGYAAQYFVGLVTSSSPQLASAVGAFVLGLLGNMYSRFLGGLAFSAMLPGVFVQVPGSLAARGSIVSGVRIADELVHGNKSLAGWSNKPAATAPTGNGFSDATPGEEVLFHMNAWKMAFGMVQIAVAITVGLFLASLVVYPRGRKGKKGSFLGF